MTQNLARSAIVAAVMILAAACTDAPTEPAPPGAPAVRPRTDVAGMLERLSTLMQGAWPTATALPILVGAGDIARCYDAPQPGEPPVITPPSQTAAEATAKLLDQIPGTVFAAGDNAYEFGSTFDYETCYQPTWGRHKSRTRPAAGNHEYLTPGAAGYFGYFAAVAAPPGGYYSYDLGGWHVVVLNSTPPWALCQPEPASPEGGRLCVGDVPQQTWLRTDLAAHRTLCTVAYFHHPRFSSGEHGSQYGMQRFWDILYANGVDVVISGHDHLYERFAPQDPEGNADPVRGIRQFTVGTGGAELYSFRTVLPNSEVRNSDTHGVLTLGLGSGSYGWAFVPVAGATFTDYGRGTCHP